MKESIKELLSFLRGIFFILLATLFSLVAYVMNNELSFIKFFLAVYVIILVAIVEGVLIVKTYKHIEKLKEI